MEDTDLTSGGAKFVSYIRVTMENFHVFANLHFSYIHFPLKMKWIKDRYGSNLLTERIQKILKKTGFPILTPEYVQIILLTVPLL